VDEQPISIIVNVNTDHEHFDAYVDHVKSLQSAIAKSVAEVAGHEHLVIINVASYKSHSESQVV